MAGGESKMDPADLRSLITRSQNGDSRAIAELRRLTNGRFEGAPREDLPPMYRAAYANPLRSGVSFGEIRAAREYDSAVVDDFVDHICNTDYLPPGAAMMLFVFMCTKHHAAMRQFGGALRMKMMAIFRAWDESHHWVQANVLDRLRHRLFEEHHHVFVRAAFARARKGDKLVEEAKRLAEEADGEKAKEEKEETD